MSIGRSHLQAHHSKESLPAHPLLSPAPSSSTSAAAPASTQLNGLAAPSSATGSPPGTKYVPYTPRQRAPAATSSPATSTNATASPTPSVTSGGATRELQRQNMKAELQGLGLSGETGGWTMLDRLSSLGAADEDWEEIWAMLTAGKATLLLPKEPLTPNEVTPELVRDHVVFCSSPSTSSYPLVTLSGLRGFVDGETITFRSTLPVHSTPFTNLISAASRAATLQTLSPLPYPLTPNPLPPYPTCTMLSQPVAVPLPPRPSPVPPPLPVRPKAAASHTGRLSIPFSSLFGSKTPAAAAAAVVQTAALPAQSITHSGEGPTIEAWAVDRVIRTREIGRDITKAVKGEVKVALAGYPSWLVDRVNSFISTFLPALKPAKGKLMQSSVPPSPSPEQALDPETFQFFYGSLSSELQSYYEHSSSPLLGRKGSKDMEREKDKDHEVDEKQVERFDVVNRVREALDRTESVVCSLLYDRIFQPIDSDDSRHDDALASRIAALNLLDLSLEHLGVDVIGGGSNEGVEEVIRACGYELQRLEDFHAPKDKANVLVSAHRIVVEGLDRLPPLRLRPEGELEPHTARPAPAQHSPEEMTARPLPSQLAGAAVADSQFDSSSPAEESDHAPSADQAGYVADQGQEVTVRTSSGPVPELHLPEPLHQLHDPSPSSIESGNPPPPPPRPYSPLALESSPSSPKPTSSADLLLPLIIFAVVKSNPAQLVSHLLYVQRYRDSSVHGEQNYCLINLSAVVEFLEHVDLGVLGLAGEERVLSIEDLTPIPLIRPVSAPPEEHKVGGRLLGTVNQVGELAASTNKVISGVVDSSFTALRGLLTHTPSNEPTATESSGGDLTKIAAWNTSRPGFGMLRRASGFSIASMAASLPGGVGTGRTRSLRDSRDDEDEEEGRPLVEVNSRPGSIREEADTETGEDDEDEEGEENESEEDGHDREEMGYRSDVRSVRSFGSMMSRESRDREDRRERMSISDRLASMAAGRFVNPKSSTADVHTKQSSPPRSRRTSLLMPFPGPAQPPSNSPSPREGSPVPTPSITRIAPPVARFMQCTPDDLRVSEVGELLREYRRVVAALNAAGGFEEGS